MAETRNRVSIDLPEELYNLAKQEAGKKYLSVGVYLRMIVAERLSLIARSRKESK